jgi:hypothetical protein
MRDLVVLLIHFIATLARLLGPGGARSLVAKSLLLLVACVLMQPVLWYGAAWFRRRRLAELNEVKKIQMNWTKKWCREVGSIDPVGQRAIRRFAVRLSV